MSGVTGITLDTVDSGEAQTRKEVLDAMDHVQQKEISENIQDFQAVKKDAEIEFEKCVLITILNLHSPTIRKLLKNGTF